MRTPGASGHAKGARRARAALALCAALGVSAVLLGACGASNPKLIPVASSEPLQHDFEEVARAAEGGHGTCASTESALIKLEGDYRNLPASVDAGLRRRLDEGIAKLRSDALELCVQPATTTPTTSTQHTTPPATTTPTTTTPPATQTTPPTSSSTNTTPPSPGGGTPGPKEGEPEPEAGGKHDHKGGEAGPSGGAGAGAGGEAPK